MAGFFSLGTFSRQEINMSMVDLTDMAELYGWKLQDGPLLPWLQERLNRERDLEKFVRDCAECSANQPAQPIVNAAKKLMSQFHD